MAMLWTSAQAQISPGKLAKAHSHLEGLSNCTQCHVLGDEVTNDKCLACHSAIQDRVSRDKGYHASSEVKSQRCAACHTDHQGREFELVHWTPSREAFNHQLSGWPLVGAHRKLECIACHKPALISDGQLGSATKTNLQKTLLGLGTDCKSCHSDEHRGQLSQDCAACHTSEAWTPASDFSHDKARFPLAGKHRDITCEKCHLPQNTPPIVNANLVQKKERTDQFTKYKELSFSNCTPCHSDPHEDKFGQDCKGCHTVSGWGQIVGTKFDHKLTKFPLVGKHVAVACIKCHTTGTMTDALESEHCSDCHKDKHQGQFADRADKGACESCHKVEGFLPAVFSMQQHDSSRYPLSGSHLAIACYECHQVVNPEAKSSYMRYDFSDLTCKGCHVDVHGGQADKWIAERGCEACHVTNTWHQVTFDHEQTTFPLRGKHVSAACGKCHTKDSATPSAVIKLKNVTTKCADCHSDIHQGQFVRAELGETQTDCKRCHVPDAWNQLVFDHNRDAKFLLDGAHAPLACVKCHAPTTNAEQVAFIRYRPLGQACADCHGSLIPPK